MSKLNEKQCNFIRRGRLPAVRGYTKKQIKSFINNKLRTNIVWAKKACVAVYALQANNEKRNDISSEHDGVGFNKNDAPILSGIARKIQNRRTLSTTDLEHLKKKMPKYACQVAHLSDKQKLSKSLSHYYN